MIVAVEFSSSNFNQHKHCPNLPTEGMVNKLLTSHHTLGKLLARFWVYNAYRVKVQKKLWHLR